MNAATAPRDRCIFEFLLYATALAGKRILGDGEIVYKFIKGLTAALVVGASALACASTAQSTTINDTIGVAPDPYVGGTPTGSLYGREIIGDYDVFAIHSGQVFTSGSNAENLVVRINTNYAGQVGTLGTEYGALFIGTKEGPGGLILNTTDGTNQDTFVGNPTRFQYALDMDYNPGTGDQNGNSTLWELDGTGNDVRLSSASGGFRRDQAWQPYTTDPDGNGEKKAATDSGLDGSWMVVQGTNSTSLNPNSSNNGVANGNQTLLTQGTGYIEFVIDDFFAAGNPGENADFLTFAWAMSCANDVILGAVLDPGNIPGVPLPGGLILLLSGLLGLGWLGRSRARQA